MKTPTELTVTDAVEVVLPIIEQLAWPDHVSTKPDSLMIACVAAAVRSAGLDCSPELAADIVQNLRRRRLS